MCVWAGLLCAPVGGGPPARSRHASLRLGVIDLEARPGPAAAHGHRTLAPPSPTGAAAWPCHRPRAPLPGPGLLYVAQWWLSIINFACNSPVACSNIEFASLELQRFLGLLKFGPIELHAKFVWRWPCEPALALPTGRSPHRGRVLRLLGCLPLHAGGAWCAVVLASSISALRSVQNSPCLASWW